MEWTLILHTGGKHIKVLKMLFLMQHVLSFHLFRNPQAELGVILFPLFLPPFPPLSV